MSRSTVPPSSEGRGSGHSEGSTCRMFHSSKARPSGYLEYRATTAQWHADRRGKRPKAAKLPENDALRQYVQDRLAGVIAASDGSAVPGPDVRWIGRRHGRRQDRRCAKSWSPEQKVDRRRCVGMSLVVTRVGR
jgi:hypothetical protein